MKTIDLSKYGITGAKEIIYNPSYEELFVAETDPTLEGYRFVGWFTSDQILMGDYSTPFNFDTVITSSFSLYAVWE